MLKRLNLLNFFFQKVEVSILDVGFDLFRV
jgi:hypothetical protein